jgi:hypothetical protein
MSASRTYQYARLRVVSAGGVALTSAASDSIYIADDADLDMGIHGFSLFARGTLPDWTPAVISYLIRKYSAGGILLGYALGILTTGKLNLLLYRSGTTTYSSTIAPSITDGTEHSFSAVVTRETATVAGSVIFYVDGVKLGDTVEIPAAATVSIDNTATFRILSTATPSPILGTMKSVRVFNRALTEAEVLALHTYDTVCQAGAVLDLAPEGITATKWEDSSPNNLDATYPATGSSITGLADFSLGRLFLGEYFEPERNYSYGYREAIVDPSILSQTIGGQRHADELEHYRTFEASGQLFSQAQWVLFQEMINTVGIRKPLFIALDYDDDSEERTLYGHFTGLPSITRDVPNLWSYSFTVEEDR